jgi:hypothetical protein
MTCIFNPPPSPPRSPALYEDEDEEMFAELGSVDYCFNKMDYMNHGDTDLLSTNDSDLSLNSNGAKARRVMERVRREHGCYFLRKKVKNYFLKVVCFATRSPPGTPIRHAITGKIEPGYYVGRKDENMFFKVRVMSGELKERSEFGNDLYYHSPDEYSRHFHVEIPVILKENWEKRRNEYMALKNIRRSGEKKPEFTIVK